MKARFSIRYKFLAVTTLLLVVCVGAYLAIAIREFKNDKRQLVFDYNQSLVVNTASDLESFLVGLADKMRLLTLFHRENAIKRQAWIADLMRNKRDLVFIAGSHKFSSIDEVYYEDKDFLQTYGLTSDFWQKELYVKRPVPLQKIQLEGEVVWNATLENGAPLIGFGKSVVEEDANGVPVNQFAVIGFVKADRLLKTLEQGKPNQVYIATRDGEVLVHTDEAIMSSNTLRTDRLIEIAAESDVKKKVTEFIESDRRYLAAYAKAFSGKVVVLSKISESKAFRAVNRLVFNSLLFSSMIVTLAFLVAILFSRSLTRPIDTLMQGMGRVSSGDLSGDIRVDSKDEIALLAGSFNKMIQDLKTSREELEEINRELENKVRERTQQLESQNRAVKEAQEALLRSTRLAAAGEIAGQAAHEVLNPLTTIISRLNKVKERLTNDRQQELQLLTEIKSSWLKDFQEGGFQKLIGNWQTPSKVKPGQNMWSEDIDNVSDICTHIDQEVKTLTNDADFLLQEAERIGRIISNFRHLSSYRGEPKEMTLHKICEKSVKIMADLASRDRIKFEQQFVATDDHVFIDEDEFVQVMTNLLRNALQSVRARHVGTDAGVIRIETKNTGGKIEVHVIDNGQGIADEHKNKLFEKNFTTKTKDEGTGIGLSISRRLIRAFKGDLRLEGSQPGFGAHFIITLPLSSVGNNSTERGVA